MTESTVSQETNETTTMLCSVAVNWSKLISDQCNCDELVFMPNGPGARVRIINQQIQTE